MNSDDSEGRLFLHFIGERDEKGGTDEDGGFVVMGWTQPSLFKTAS